MNGLRTHNALTLCIAGITAACFSGCSVTQPTMKIGLALYPPAGAEVENTEAYQLVRWNLGDQEIALSPRGSLDDMLDLWISVENQGEDAVEFSPSQIQYSYCRSAPANGKPISPKSSAPICEPFAPVPTQAQAAAHLAQRDQKRKEADDADEAAMTLVAIVFVFAFIAVAAAASSGGSSQRGSGHSYGHSHNHGFVPFFRFAEAATHVVSHGGSYTEAPPYVSPEAFSGGNLNNAIAASVIAAGDRHAGHIFVPPSTNASLLRLQIGVGRNTTTVKFDYKAQKEARPAPQNQRGM